MNTTKTKKMVGIAIFTAIVVVLQFTAVFLRFSQFSLSLVLIPIVVGAGVYGPVAGAWLGFAFGITVLLSGDAAAFLAVNPFGAIVTVIVKGTLAGLCAGLVYKLVEKKNKYVAITLAALTCPIVNTGIFLIGCLVFFMDAVRGWASALGFGDNAGQYMIVGLVGINFIIEVALNVVLIPVIARIIKIGKNS